jgi:hypothetical protein
MINIQPQYLPLADLLAKRLFRIPEYQRAYSWGKYQREDLFSDIQKTLSKGDDAAHFMAAVVGLRREKQRLGTDDYYVVEVVDGQQRLTTLIILLKTIELGLDKSDKAQSKPGGELADLLVKTEGNELLLLQTNHDSSHYFADFLRGGKSVPPISAKTVADKEILAAIADCKSFTEQWKKRSGDLMSLAALLKNRLFFLLHEIDDEKAVYTVFEVLNSRGLIVSWMDRLKSILMGTVFELKNVNQAGIIAELHNIWRDIYSVIGLRQGLNTETLRFAATLRAGRQQNKPFSEEDSVEQLRVNAVSAKSIIEVASWLLHVTRACDEVAANVRVNAVARIAQARLLAVAIRLREDLTTAEREGLLARWEKVTFRIYGMLSNDARTRVGEYIRLAWQVVNGKQPAAQIDPQIRVIGFWFPIEDAIKALQGTDCYTGWENELRYMLFRYEEHLAQQQNQKFSNEQWERIWNASAADSIEHILAQSAANDENKHRLGNLVLLPPNLNSQLQDRPPGEKIESYRKTGLLIAGEVADLIDQKGWNEKIIIEREQKILEWARIEWDD